MSSAANSQRPSKEKPYFIMRDEHKPVYAASSVPGDPGIDYDYESDDGDKNPLSMPGYQQMLYGKN